MPSRNGPTVAAILGVYSATVKSSSRARISLVSAWVVAMAMVPTRITGRTRRSSPNTRRDPSGCWNRRFSEARATRRANWRTIDTGAAGGLDMGTPWSFTGSTRSG